MRSPIAQLFGRVTEHRAHAFVMLFALDAVYRALLITIVPQRAYALLGSAARVTMIYLLAAFFGLAVNLLVPSVVHRFGRGKVLVGATFFALLSCALLAAETVPALILGLIFQIAIGATLEVLINIAMLENIARRDLNRFEPLRLLFVGTAFVLGPWLGVVLDSQIAHNLTFAVAAILSVTLLAAFRAVGLASGPGSEAGTPLQHDTAALAPPNPLALIPRFAAQPRLVLAWALAIGRNGWWYMYYVYAPILIASFGYSRETAGAVVSIGMLPMFLTFFWASFGTRFGIRELLTWSYAATGMATIAVGLSSGLPRLSLVLLCLAACCATSIDGAGNVPFLRAVRPLERAQMTSVFMTFRHAASILMPATFSVVLLVAPLSGIFVASGAIALAMAGLSRYLPRRL